MDPLRFALALGPIGVYLMLIGVLHARRRPTVISGGRDLAALLMSMVGLVAVGPVELLVPGAVANQLGAHLWALLAVLYSLCTSMLAINSAPRLVIYQAPPLDEFRTALGQALGELDPDARWAGTSVYLPKLHVEFNVEIARSSHTIVLRSVHPFQDRQSWQQLHAALAGQLAAFPQPTNGWSLALGGGGGALLAMVFWRLAQQPQEVTQALFDMLRW